MFGLNLVSLFPASPWSEFNQLLPPCVGSEEFQDKRAPGLHCSSILDKALMQEREDKEFVRNNLTEIGNYFEYSLISSLVNSGYAYRGLQLMDSKTGLYYTPDAFRNHSNLVVIEVKATMKYASFVNDAKFERMIMQVLFYCTMLNTPYGELHVIFLRGNGSGIIPWYCVLPLNFGDDLRGIAREYIDNQTKKE